MTNSEKREAARQFYNKWHGKGKEHEDDQSYWIDILERIMGVSNATDYLQFQKTVIVDGNAKFIDAYIPETRVLIEQKSFGVDLDKKYPQSGGAMLTPYEQAKRYNDNLIFDEKARWIVVSNFSKIRIYNMNEKVPKPETVLISDLQSKYSMLDFLVKKEERSISHEEEVSLDAGKIVGLLYDALLRQYQDPESPDTMKSLNVLCVRLVFCLYAEDSDVFGKKNIFYDYLKNHVNDARQALINLFKVLDTKPEERDPYMDDDLAAFPYVNGGLFEDESVVIPRLSREIVDLILTKASKNFDWSQISPTIFGAVFESTLNPETRRSGGMHYTSVENIHKVIDPLFLDDLKEELSKIKEITIIKDKRKKLEDYQKKLASLTFLDPAAGSGNFLTETYLSLRRLENAVIRELMDMQKGATVGQISLAFVTDNPIQVSIGQFYGIEINDFAVTVARTALWIAESQMMQETENVVHMVLDYLPLKTAAHIVEGNALRMDWETVVPKDELDYIMGNPPFVGARIMSLEQKADVISIFGEKWKNVGNLDYVCCWYKKSAELIFGTSIRAALVSTNSVTQGEQVANLWEPLFAGGVHFDFAYRTFRWDSEAKIKAHVHCVIVGFSTASNNRTKFIYTDGKPVAAQNINGYLLDAPSVFVESRNKPICDVPQIGIGNKPIDGGNYLFTKDEMEDFLKKEPEAEKYFRPWYGSYEFINRRPRWCLWLGDCPPEVLRQMPECMKRIEAVRKYRLASKSAGTVKLADRPTRFHVENMPASTYIIIPRVSSENRRYVPMGFLTPDILTSDSAHIIPSATLYHFGVLTSNVHMAWMRSVCGRLKSDYRYSKNIVYNNFPWPNLTAEQKAKIEETAQEILDARALYPDASLADLYDELTMPPELSAAHQNNDRAVMRAYGFNVGAMSEADCVAELMRMYQELTK